jgi:hypothetical protein
MKKPIRDFLSIDTLVLAFAGIWMISVLINLIT